MMKISFESTFTVLFCIQFECEGEYSWRINMHSCAAWEEKLCDSSSAFSTEKLWENMEEITNSKKRKREIRNEKLRKARQAKFEKRQRVEKISQFRRIADLQNNLREEMYELAAIAHRQYSRSK